MKFTKTNYQIIGRFENGSKYGMITKKDVTGYIAEEFPGIAFKKNNSTWGIDHIASGLAIAQSAGSTRAQAVEYYKTMENRVNEICGNPEKLQKMIQNLADTVPEEVAAAFEKYEYTTLYDHRLDKVTAAAKKAGLIVRNVKEETYLHGGKIEIIGTAEKIAEIKNLINEKENVTMKKEVKAQEVKEEVAEPVKVEEPAQVVEQEEPVKVEQEEPNAEQEEKNDLSDIIAEIKAGNFEVLLPLLAMNHGNKNAIISAGIAAQVFTVPEMLAFLTRGIMPDYHTFNEWKSRGYIVNKGEKAAFAAYIWKHTDKPETEEPEPVAETEEPANGGPDFIRKKAYFFGPAQVNAVPYKPFSAPGVNIEIRGKYEVATGDTRTHKEELKAAGFTWNSKVKVWLRVKPENRGPEDPQGSPAPVEPEKADTDAERIAQEYEASRERIASAELSEEQRARLFKDIDKARQFADAAAALLESVPSAAGKVYDINGRAAALGTEVTENRWGRKEARRTADGWRAYISESSYSKTKYICIYLDNNRGNAEIEFKLTTADGKKPRIDAEKTAENLKRFINGKIDTFTKTADFAEKVKAMEEKKRAALAMLAEISKETTASYDTVRAFGLQTDRAFAYGSL